ncbi:hypothetical protein C0Z17_17060 [Trinickia caryophylli]|nr:hypothetical protein C0Z17_17060 [Trinickia caryophylli]
MACSTENSVREHYRPTEGLAKRSSGTGQKKFTFSVTSDFAVYTDELRSLLAQGYYVKGASIWLDQNSDDYLKQSIDVRSENWADVVLVNAGFDHEDEMLFDRPLPACCSKPRREQGDNCDCCKKQDRIKRYWYRHVIHFLAK